MKVNGKVLREIYKMYSLCIEGNADSLHYLYIFLKSYCDIYAKKPTE